MHSVFPHLKNCETPQRRLKTRDFDILSSNRFIDLRWIRWEKNEIRYLTPSGDEPSSRQSCRRHEWRKKCVTRRDARASMRDVQSALIIAFVSLINCFFFFDWPNTSDDDDDDDAEVPVDADLTSAKNKPPTWSYFLSLIPTLEEPCSAFTKLI